MEGRQVNGGASWAREGVQAVFYSHGGLGSFLSILDTSTFRKTESLVIAWKNISGQANTKQGWSLLKV